MQVAAMKSKMFNGKRYNPSFVFKQGEYTKARRLASMLKSEGYLVRATHTGNGWILYVHEQVGRNM